MKASRGHGPWMGVRTPDIVSKRLGVLHDISGLSFRDIAKLDEFTPVPAGTLCSIYNGESIPKKWRSRFGLAEEAKVIVLAGEVPPGAQIVGVADVCTKCAEWYISNHPRRKRCFICSPYKGRVREMKL